MFRPFAMSLLCAAMLSLAACEFSFGGKRFEGGGVTFLVPFENSQAQNGAGGIAYKGESVSARTNGRSLVVNENLYGDLKQGDVVDLTQRGVVKVNGEPRASLTADPVGGTWTLPSSHPVTVLGAKVLLFDHGDSAALEVDYQTDLSVSDLPALGHQADEVLEHFKPQLEKAHVPGGVASAREAPDAQGHVRGYNFVYHRSADGRWTRVEKH
jgi:hypothetical protein